MAGEKNTRENRKESQPPEKRTDKLHDGGAIITISHGNDDDEKKKP